MNSSTPKETIKNLIPVLSEKEKQEIQAYYTVYEKYSEEFSAKATEDLKNHPVFGKLIRDIPKEVSESRNKVSRALQKDAIVNDNWQPYIEYQIAQGVTYAKMGLDFKSWYEVIALVRNYMRPLLRKEYENAEKLFSSLSGMNRFLDISMGIIGEAYMQEKEEIVRSNEAKLKQAQAIAHIGSWEIDFATGISTWSEEACRIHGLLPDENQQSFESWLSFIHPEDLEYVKKEIEKSNASLSDTILNHRIMRKDGTVRNIYSISKFALNHEGKPTGLYGIAHDVTEQKIAEEVIKNQNEELEQKVIERTAQLETVNKELEAFSYSISHDLRAPLRAVNGYAQMLNEDYGTKLDEEGKRIIETIRYNAGNMGTLIDELLAFSKLGRKEVQRTKINMNELVEGVFKDMDKSLTLKAEIKIGKLHQVEADYGLLKQVMLNLISNALKYSSKKEHPIVEIFSEEKQGEIVFSVKDNGAGFDMKYYDKLFGVFQRLHKQSEFDGVGVGLAIVQRVIAKHGGKVWAEGKVNEGAAFNFTLTQN